MLSMSLINFAAVKAYHMLLSHNLVIYSIQHMFQHVIDLHSAASNDYIGDTESNNMFYHLFLTKISMVYFDQQRNPVLKCN